MPRTSWRGGIVTRSVRAIPEETPIAFTYNRATHAVMLATPSDLEDFAVGLSLSEGIIDRPADIGALEVVALPRGIELRMDLRPDRMDALTRRHRHMAGASGCGLCGIESLDEAIRPVPRVESDARVPPSAILAAMASMHPEQALNDQTHGVHAAAFWTETRGMVALREDVGRHNALDKLIGALALRHVPTAHGILLLTSRVSVEMVQKAATLGVPVLAAISVPTALAVQVAEQAGITLIAIARADGFEVFTHSHRITTEPVQHVA